MTAEQLIDQYLEQMDSDPKFKKQMNKGQSVKKDKVLDIMFRTDDANIDQDITWRSSSKSPYG